MVALVLAGIPVLASPTGVIRTPGPRMAQARGCLTLLRELPFSRSCLLPGSKKSVVVSDGRYFDAAVNLTDTESA